MGMKKFLKDIGVVIYSVFYFSAISVFIFIPAFAIAEFANSWWGLFVALIGSVILISIDSIAVSLLAIPIGYLIEENPIGKYISMIMCIIVSIAAIILIWILMHPTKWVLAAMIVLTLKNIYYASTMYSTISTIDK